MPHAVDISVAKINRIHSWRLAFCDQTTGIIKSVEDLLWDYAAFQTAIKIIEIDFELRVDGSRVNKMLFDLIRQGYWSSFLLGARRLLDKGHLSGPKGVYSIRSVINDVRACQGWLTREVYVAFVCGAEPDLLSLEKAQTEISSVSTQPFWGNKSIEKSRAAHLAFDEISGVSRQSRSFDDKIDPALFDKVDARLGRLSNIVDHVDSHLAHAGNTESRQIKPHLDNFDIGNARDALKQIKRTF